jgi:glyoxylase-like metal-dependent hydrolase (beta-lactamase superfamily II)
MPKTAAEHVQPLPGGIHAIDTGFHRPRFDASYLMVEGRRAAFIDTGTNHAVPRLLGALEALGLAPEAVDFVIPTHVHLDHAGGTGVLMQHLPAATVWVHPHGLRHLVDPSMLVASATRVYGEAEIVRSYGRIAGVDPARIRATDDGTEIHLAGRALRFLHTPGHARHHHCIWDERTRGFFTGDTFGLSYREFDSPQGAWLLPTTTPVQFEPELLRASVQRLLAADPACMYLTHFGRIDDVARLGATFLAQLDELVALGHRLRAAPDRHAALRRGLRAIYLERVAQHGCALAPAQVEELLAIDIELNAQGMGLWLDRKARGRPLH